MSRMLLIALASLAAAGCASTQTQPSAAAAPKASAAQQPAKPCLSASAIPQTNCDAFGRSYSQDDLRRTGQVNPGAALQMLDPSISSH
ncbi:MAG: hypothetical protein JO341_04560 [Gammaproteobacteria bacterium]|nr:hypothetical protein [Gammaproteobacteria bacterium]MBV9620275.1 hypothetical protein [Gammaproteobacteria bacterium]